MFISERKLTETEISKRQDIIKSLLKNKHNLVKRYGSDAEKVMYGIATKKSKKQVENMNLENVRSIIQDSLKPLKEKIISQPNDEPYNLKKELARACKMAKMLFDKMDNYPNQDFPQWFQKKIIQANSLLDEAFDYLEGEERIHKIDSMLEAIGDTTSTGQILIRNLTPQKEEALEKLKEKYPNLNAKFVSNNNMVGLKGRDDLRGTYTLSYSFTHQDDQLASQIGKELNNIDKISLEESPQFPDITTWWEYPKEDILSFIYWKKRQVPPTGEKGEQAWKHIKSQLEKKYPQPLEENESFKLEKGKHYHWEQTDYKSNDISADLEYIGYNRGNNVFKVLKDYSHDQRMGDELLTAMPAIIRDIKRGKFYPKNISENLDKGKMSCNKPKRDTKHKTKSHVVKACEDGKEKIIRFGQQGVKGAGSNPKSEKQKNRKKAFKARHKSNIKKGKMSAAYWADKVKW